MTKYCIYIVFLSGSLLLSACGSVNNVENTDPVLVQANSGDAISEYNIGTYYLNGDNGYKQDDKKAFYWFKKSADKGFSSAQNNLAIMYLRGFGISQNLDEAQKYYLLAANQGHNLNLLNIGDLKSKAKFWLEKASNYNDLEAKKILKK